MPRFILLMVCGALVASGLMYAMAVSYGIDPLAPEVRTFALVSLAVAAYVGLRFAMIISKVLRRRAERRQAEADGVPMRESRFKRWGRNPELDARMAARRARVEAAQQRGDASAGPDSD